MLRTNRYALDADSREKARKDGHDAGEISRIRAPIPSTRVPVCAVMFSAEESSDVVVSLAYEKVIGDDDADDVREEDLVGAEVGCECEGGLGEVPWVDGEGDDHADERASAVVDVSSKCQCLFGGRKRSSVAYFGHIAAVSLPAAIRLANIMVVTWAKEKPRAMKNTPHRVLES